MALKVKQSSIISTRNQLVSFEKVQTERIGANNDSIVTTQMNSDGIVLLVALQPRKKQYYFFNHTIERKSE